MIYVVLISLQIQEQLTKAQRSRTQKHFNASFYFKTRYIFYCCNNVCNLYYLVYGS